MLRFNDFVTCRKRYYNQSRGFYNYSLEYNVKLKFSSSDFINTIEHCRKIKFRTYALLTLINKIFYVVTVE